MWNSKNSRFQFVIYLIFTWIIVDLTIATQDADSKTEMGADADNRLNLNEQLYEFAQIFSMVNSIST